MLLAQRLEREPAADDHGAERETPVALVVHEVPGESGEPDVSERAIENEPAYPPKEPRFKTLATATSAIPRHGWSASSIIRPDATFVGSTSEPRTVDSGTSSSTSITASRCRSEPRPVPIYPTRSRTWFRCAETATPWSIDRTRMNFTGRRPFEASAWDRLIQLRAEAHED